MKALVLAGGFDQIALIEELKNRGYYVILADYYENPMAKKVADKHYQISTLDLEKVIEVAEQEKVDLITTACTDQALLIVAKASEKLGLPCYLNSETALNVTNKEYMKKKFVEYDIPTAKYIIVDSTKELEQKIAHLSYPLIVKPVDCNSSKGVLKINGKSELLPAVLKAIGLSRSKSAVIEEFISGDEYTVDFWIDGCVPKLLMVSEITKFKNRDTFTINGCRTLPDLSESKIKQLEEIAFKIAKAFRLNNMPMFMQVIDGSENIYCLEFSARMGGGTKYRMIDIYSGVSIMKIYVDRVLEQKVTIPTILTRKHMFLSFIYCTTGVFKEIVGIKQLIDNGIIDEWYQYKATGTFFDKAENSGDRVAGILITGKNDDEIAKKLNIAKDNLKVLDVNNRDIFLKIF